MKPTAAGGNNTKLKLQELAVQNLRGFTEATLSFDTSVLFLVGPNNAGKTSFFKLMDVLFNKDLDDELESVSDELMDVLMPARETRNTARRITLRVEVKDGRRHTRFDCRNGIATLRLSLRKVDRRLRLNLGDPRRGEQHDAKAYDLLKELRDSFSFVYIPATRSTDSDSFRASTFKAIADSLASAFEKPGKGADREERAAAGALETVRSLSEPANKFWEELVRNLPSGWVREQNALPEIDRDALSRFLAEHILLTVATGEHDAAGVRPRELGSGLQSLISLEFHRSRASDKARAVLLAIEEPEVFLHPSAQRTLGRRLARGELGCLTLVSTHSPLIVEEASFEQISIVRDHKISQPWVDDARRSEINASLMQGRGAEAFFARSVLLVEGPGDREYWEALRRRVAPSDDGMAVDECYVIEAGSNAKCAPWLQLFQSFRGSPIRWTVLLDADSTKQLAQAATDAGIHLSRRQQHAVAAIRAAFNSNDLQGIENGAKELADLKKGEARLLLAPGDLESLMCVGLSDETKENICEEISLPRGNAPRLAERLGTIHRTGGRATNSPMKAPWIRSRIGRATPPAELGDFASSVLATWIAGASSLDHGREVVRRFRLSC